MCYVPPRKSRHRRLDMPALSADQQSFCDQYGLRIACLEQAVAASSPDASTAEVVADAARRHAAYSAFLKGRRSAS